MDKIINSTRLLEGIRYLAAKDKKLAEITAEYGPPPLWQRKEGFATLIRIILEQQVSLQSAKAAYDKLEKKVGQVTPDSFLSLGNEELKCIGFSRQKAGYWQNLAKAAKDGTLDFVALRNLPDNEVIKKLTTVKGIGPWTANIYLLMALCRQDVWPDGDLALELAAQKLYGLKNKPTPKKLLLMSKKWQPWRAVAARMLYHFYLNHGKN